ncbi:MAG: zinc ribbon domain-containing protein [Candidatus Eisenbacteria bacterium]|nr:zinc ribbon domain-containing protein [Candidatus Eisenbacteria bacterium]
MPLYQYCCRKCGSLFEALLPVAERDQEEKKLACPCCGATNPTRQISRFSAAAESKEHRCAPRRG